MIFGAAIAGLSVISLAIVSLLLESIASPPKTSDDLSRIELRSK